MALMRSCAVGILLNEFQVLLGKRSLSRDLYPDYWDFPGGHCQADESVVSALLRELKEEVNVVATKYEEIAILTECSPDLYGEREYYVFLVRDWIGQPRNKTPDEHSEIAWFPLDQAKNLKLAHPDYPRILHEVLNRAHPVKCPKTGSPKEQSPL